MKQKIPTYNDGFATIYRRKETELTANRNVNSLEQLNPVIKFAYSEASRRQQDLDFAEQNSFSLSMKIKVPKPVVKKGLDTSCYAVIDNTLYGIEYIDTNSTEYFFYLEKVRELEG